jgi:hypothetical protein
VGLKNYYLTALVVMIIIQSVYLQVYICILHNTGRLVEGAGGVGGKKVETAKNVMFQEKSLCVIDLPAPS